ncbi:MAG TPA: aminotransferase class V-fold PLP-dependent enzyme [Bryobacteraceae bacterium]|nr:aminotransferase class V-fold PLP-dependent enzyme [Bryobacteraceae bacterium]
MIDDPLEQSRRKFIARSGAGLASLAAVKAAYADTVSRVAASATPGWRTDEGYWGSIRKKFLLEDGLAYLNNGTVGPTPAPVYQNLMSYWRMMAENPNENSATLQGRMDLIRAKAALFLGAEPDEIAILRNATEGNNLVAQGIDLKAGDEVLIGYLEHDSVRQPWLLKAKRQGVVIKEVPIHTPPQSPEEIVSAFEAAITPRTKAIATAHCDTVTGTFSPIKMLAALAQTKGLFCFADGAQVPGMVPVNVHDLGVHTYATTCHKWLCAPAGTGLLYVRRDMQDRIWPNIVSEYWWTLKDARKYEHVSRRPWPVVAALEDAIDFQNAIGRPRIEARIRALSGYLRAQAAEIPHVKLYTSQDPRLSGAMTSLGMDNVPSAKLREYLRQRFDVYTADRTVGNTYPADPHGVSGIRVSTHYYNTFEQVERVLQGLRELAKG